MITFDPDRLSTRLADLDEEISRPGFWDDQERATRASSERARVARRLDLFAGLTADVADAGDLVEMAADDADLAAELAATVRSLTERIDELEEGALFTGEYDGGAAVVTISAGAGGTDAMDWAEMLLRMYTRWAEKRGYSYTVVDSQVRGKGERQRRK